MKELEDNIKKKIYGQLERQLYRQLRRQLRWPQLDGLIRTGFEEPMWNHLQWQLHRQLLDQTRSTDERT